MSLIHVSYGISRFKYEWCFLWISRFTYTHKSCTHTYEWVIHESCHICKRHVTYVKGTCIDMAHEMTHMWNDTTHMRHHTYGSYETWIREMIYSYIEGKAHMSTWRMKWLICETTYPNWDMNSRHDLFLHMRHVTYGIGMSHMSHVTHVHMGHVYTHRMSHTWVMSHCKRHVTYVRINHVSNSCLVWVRRFKYESCHTYAHWSCTHTYEWVIHESCHIARGMSHM